MTDDGDVLQTDDVSEELDHETHGRSLIRGLDGTLLVAAVDSGNDQPGSLHTDSLNPARQEARKLNPPPRTTRT